MKKTTSDVEGARKVASIMSRPAVTVRQDLSLPSLAALLIEQGLSRVPVVDEKGHAVGMVGKTDLVEEQVVAGESMELGPATLKNRRGVEETLPNSHVEVEPRTVGDVMTPKPITVSADSPIWMAAALMAERGLHGLPVVSDEGKVVGMLSSLDVVRWVASTKRE